MEVYVDQLKLWYENFARPFLADYAADRLALFDGELNHLLQFLDLDKDEFPICILGKAGVGKSTLINTLVAKTRVLLPQGGVGPLTAQATTVRYSDSRYFEVEYQTRRRLNQLLFALERHHERSLKIPTGQVPLSDMDIDLSEDDLEEIELAQSVSKDPEHRDDDKINAFIKQTALIIRGDQYAKVELPYLLDALRVCISTKKRWGSTIEEQDEDRIERVRAALVAAGAGTAVKIAESDGKKLFRKSLKRHASGHLAPLIKTLNVGWDAEVLGGGLVLVDLPGVGVANDNYRKVTADWIRRAKAVILVVDRSGVDEASADLLRTTGFFNSLLHESADSPELSQLILTVVKLDLSATDAAREEREEEDPPYRKWVDHFDEACTRSITVFSNQLREQLENLTRNGSETGQDERLRVVERVLSELKVHPVAPVEYRNLLVDDEFERPRIKSAHESKMPQLESALQDLASARQLRLHTEFDRSLKNFMDGLNSTLSLIRSDWEEDTRASEEIARLRGELDVFLKRLQREFDTRRGQFREFLRSTIPNQIGSIVQNAAITATSDIDRYLRRLQNYHWATLRAAIRRGGTYEGAKHVDLPNELALRFEEPLAIAWRHQVLEVLIERSKELGANYVRFVKSLLNWAQENGAESRLAVLEEYLKQLSHDVHELNEAGERVVGDLREQIKVELFESVNETIATRCRRFVNSAQDRGTGTKNRIMEFLREELRKSALAGAVEAANRVLSGAYQPIQSQIAAVFERYPNPLESAAERIVSSEEARIKKNDADQRRVVLNELNEVQKSMPKKS